MKDKKKSCPQITQIHADSLYFKSPVPLYFHFLAWFSTNTVSHYRLLIHADRADLRGRGELPQIDTKKIM
jgi:hypothetical protein